MQRNRYAFLDGIRGIAAAFVIIRHTSLFWDFAFFRSYLAVDMFFILSGFVIASAYEEKLRTGLISARDFVAIRIIRLYPVYFASLLLCAVSFLIGAMEWSAGVSPLDGALVLLAAAFFLPYKIVSNQLFALNAPYWSLFYELVANVSYGIVRPVLSNRVLAALVVLFGLVVSVAALHAGKLDVGFTWSGWSIFSAVARSFFGISLGVLIFRERKSLDRRFGRFDAPWLAVLAVVLVLASPSFGPLDPFIDIAVIMCVFPLCLILAYNGVSRAEPVLLLLGSASYPMYVLHKPVAEAIYFVSPPAVASAVPYGGLALLVFLVVFSVWLERVYDIPVRRRLTKLMVASGGPRQIRAPAASARGAAAS